MTADQTMKEIIEKMTRKVPINYDVLRRVVVWLHEKGHAIDDESIAYGVPEDVVYPCTREEFDELHTALERTFDLEEHAFLDTEDSIFPQWIQWFVFEGFAFEWFMMSGQGTAIQLAPPEAGRTPFIVEDCIVISADGNHVVPEARRQPVGVCTREPDERLVYPDQEDSLQDGLNELLAEHGLVAKVREVRQDGGLYIKVEKLPQGALSGCL